MISRHHQPGQTVIEVVMALALLALVIMSSATLFNTSTRLNAESGRRTQALALANQEIEALRFYRDEQRRQNNSWSSSMPPVGSGCINFVMEEVTSSGNSRYIIRTGLSQESGQSTLHQSYPPARDNFNGTFRRLGIMCASREYDLLTRRYISSDQVRTVEVEVVWEEASAPTRTSSIRTIISNWDNQ